jgi:hypothetical protein
MSRCRLFVPDLLAEHVLWAAFFSTRWHATLDYQEIWKVAAPSHLLRLVQVLGRLPIGAMTHESPALRTTREELIMQAETASEQTIGTVLTLARELARGVPSLAVDIVDIALGRLPQASEQRDRALATASEAIKRVVKQLEGLTQLRRVAKGLPGAYNIQPSDETCKLASKTLGDIQRWLADRLSELPLPLRAEALSVLHGDSNAAVADATLSEYIMVAHPRPLRRRGQTWQESQEYRIADADIALQRLRSAESPTDHLDQWATWIEEGRRAIGRRTSSPVIGMALERAAMADAGQAAGWIRHLIDTESTLLETVMPALAVIFRDPAKGQSLADEWASHGSARIRALTASALPGSPNERRLLGRLAGDDDPLVRQGVLGGIRYSPLLEGWRIDIALCAAQGNDMAAVELVLTLVERAVDESDTALALSSTQVDRMSEIVLATAADESTYELSRIISQLTDRPRLAFEWATARVTFLARRDEEVRDVESFDTILSMHLDPLPPEILDLLPNTTDEADLSTALDRLGETSLGDTFSFNALADIVASLDCGHHLVTDRIAEWINRNAEGDEYRASKLLESRLPWEAFTDRGRILLNRVENPRLIATLISVRDPNSWAGSVIPPYEALQEQYSEWGQDENGKLASAGRYAVARLQRMIDAEREREAVEDDDWKWLRPAARVSWSG